MGIIGVHGWLYSDQRTYSDPRADYQLWSQGFQAPITTFEYWARPTFVQALLNGYPNNYQWAWDLALEAGTRYLPQLIFANPGAPLVAHSLGSLAALSALRHASVERVILLGGTAFTDFARQVAASRPETLFINLYSRDDSILKYLATVFGPKFRSRVIGRHGAEDIHLPNWINIELPGARHRDYFANPQFWPILRQALAHPHAKSTVCGVNFPELPWNKRPRI